MIINFQGRINKRTTRYQIHCFSYMFFFKGIFQDGIQQEWVSIESHSQPVLVGEAELYFETLGCSMHGFFLVPLFSRHQITKPKFSVKEINTTCLHHSRVFGTKKHNYLRQEMPGPGVMG